MFEVPSLYGGGLLADAASGGSTTFITEGHFNKGIGDVRKNVLKNLFSKESGSV